MKTVLDTNGHASEWRGLPIHPRLRGCVGKAGLASAPFRSERVSGRVFFSNLGGLSAESIVLTQVVARAVGESLDQIQAARQPRDIGGRDQRIVFEQRQSRHFIDDLKPGCAAVGEDVLSSRLQDLGERAALEWKIPVTIRINQHPAALSDRLEQAIPAMAHEAIVNAAKHAQPSRISVDVMADEGTLRLVVSDDGCGFPFRGPVDYQRICM